MPFVGLVQGRDWEPPESWFPDDTPARRPRPALRVPWRALGWLVAVVGLLFLAPLAAHAFGGVAGYVVLLLAVTLGLLRIERWCARQYWRGLRDYQA